MPTNPLPQRDVRVAEFMADKPTGKRYEVRFMTPEDHFTYEVRFFPDGINSLRVEYTYTLWGARRAIRKHRKRVNQYADLAGSLVFWERF